MESSCNQGIQFSTYSMSLAGYQPDSEGLKVLAYSPCVNHFSKALTLRLVNPAYLLAKVGGTVAPLLAAKPGCALVMLGYR
jgi:hypothetical protein